MTPIQWNHVRFLLLCVRVLVYPVGHYAQSSKRFPSYNYIRLHCIHIETKCVTVFMTSRARSTYPPSSIRSYYVTLHAQ